MEIFILTQAVIPIIGNILNRNHFMMTKNMVSKTVKIVKIN